MSEEKIRVRCPVCGAALKVKYSADMDEKSLKCPICDTASKFASFHQMPTPIKANEETDYRRNETEAPESIGTLLHLASEARYQLLTGSNLIGRKAANSTAQIQIDTDDLYMSRSHAEITVVKSKKSGFLHYFKNAKNKNNTFVNGLLVNEGDQLILEGGEVIRMGRTEIRFELPKGMFSSKADRDCETEY